MANEPAPEQKKSSLKLIIIGLVILLVLAGGGLAAWKFLLAPGGGDGASAGGAAEVPVGATSGNLVSVSVPPFLVNLADPLGRRYIKLTLELEVPNAKIGQDIESKMPRVRDTINLLLSSKTYSDLASYESKILLKNEIMERVNQSLGGVRVVRVNFLELVIQ